MQIVGATLRDAPEERAGERLNFVSERDAASYAALYRADDVRGGHVIMLGRGNDDAARSALAAWPGGLQVGGGIAADNAEAWLDAGASHVVVTSWLFCDRAFDIGRLRSLAADVGRERLVVDLSCRWREGAYWVVSNRWQTFTDLRVDAAALEVLAEHCAEFLVHGVDVEGLTQGIDLDLVTLLAEHSPIPATYAGGARSIDDLRLVHEVGNGRVHLTIGSALDIFGGHGVTYAECVAFNRAHPAERG